MVVVPRAPKEQIPWRLEEDLRLLWMRDSGYLWSSIYKNQPQRHPSALFRRYKFLVRFRGQPKKEIKKRIKQKVSKKT